MSDLWPEMSGSTPWTLDRISRDERNLDLLVPTMRGPGITATEPAVRVIETPTTVEIRVTQRISFPGPETRYVGSPGTVSVRLDAPLGDRRLMAAPVDHQAFPEWFGTGWQAEEDVDAHRFDAGPSEPV
ncbi:MAG: hypothetical protein M3417_01190 [Actinomycetota bacterium]|nr:hypothetical protein [Actinomycetota bacterium]